ncbi:MAG: tetratricopeptide repeat protein, partial [Chloroflexi bacterium]
AGSALNLLQRGRDAIKALTIAQRLAGELGDEPLGRAADYQLAVATRIAGNPRGAREMLEALLRRIESAKPPDQLLRLRVLITMGGCAQDLGEPQAATTYYQQALEWSSEIGDLARIAFIHQGLGNAYRALGDHDAAAGHYQKALASAELGKDLVGVLIMRNALAVIAADAGRIEAAYEHVARAIEIARVSGPAAYLAHCYATRAEVALKARDVPLARSSAEAAIAAVAERGADADRAVAGATLVLAELDLREGDTAKAERRMRDVAAIYKSLDAKAELGDVLMRLSRSAKRRGDVRAAERYATQAYTVTSGCPRGPATRSERSERRARWGGCGERAAPNPGQDPRGPETQSFCWRSAAVSTFRSSSSVVTAPRPPGTGLSAAATADTLSTSTSPTIP